MNAAAILRLLREHRATVQAIGGNLRLRAPAPLPEDVLDTVRTHKAELLALLAQPPAPSEAKASTAADPTDDNWIERAAICKHDAGMNRSDAELVADSCHPAPHDAEPTDWRAWFDAEVAARVPAMGWAAAERRVWGIACNRWHHLHGEQSDPHHCAGCGGQLDGTRFPLPDGVAIHDDSRFASCLIRYSRRWRSRAAMALEALGLREPKDGSR